MISFIILIRITQFGSFFFLVSIMSMIYYTLFVEVGFLGKHSTYVVNFVV